MSPTLENTRVEGKRHGMWRDKIIQEDAIEEWDVISWADGCTRLGRTGSEVHRHSGLKAGEGLGGEESECHRTTQCLSHGPMPDTFWRLHASLDGSREMGNEFRKICSLHWQMWDIPHGPFYCHKWAIMAGHNTLWLCQAACGTMPVSLLACFPVAHHLARTVLSL